MTKAQNGDLRMSGLHIAVSREMITGKIPHVVGGRRLPIDVGISTASCHFPGHHEQNRDQLTTS